MQRPQADVARNQSRLDVKDVDDEQSIKHVTGVLPFESVAGFERLLWRACRGNVFFIHAHEAVLFEVGSHWNDSSSFYTV